MDWTTLPPAGCRAPTIRLGGATRSEASSKEILQHAKDERLQRRLARESPRAAIRIQRAWRGYTARTAARKALQSEWVRRYGSLAPDPHAAASFPSVADCVLNVLPLSLALLLPPPLFSRQRTILLEGGSLSHASAANTCLKGTLLLILRHLSSEHSLAHVASLWQRKRMCILCCGILGVHEDPLVQIAASRIVRLLVRRDNSSDMELVWWLTMVPMLPAALGRIIRQRSTAKHSQNSPSVPLKQMTSAVNNLMEAEIEVVGIEASEPIQEGHHGTALEFFINRVLTLPGVLLGLSTETIGLMKRLYLPLTEYAVASASKLDATAALQLSLALGGFLVRGDAAEVPNLTRALSALLAVPGATAMQGYDVSAARTGGERIAIDETVLESVLQLFGNHAMVVKLQSAMTLPAFCTLYATLIEIVDATAASETRILSALAFGRPFLLPRVWHWLACNAGLPLEVAAEAVAFDISSLPDGIYSLRLDVRPPFALFCRTCLHYLAVADDIEFYEEQTVFTLAQLRAMATGLTAVVFRSFVETPRDVYSTQPLSKRSAQDSIQHTAAIAAAFRDAPRLLGALFDRDSRRQFCLPSLWLEPYLKIQRTSHDISSTTVLRALLHENIERRRSTNIRLSHERYSDDDDEGARSPSVLPSSPQLRDNSANGQLARSEASGVAKLLLQAPQCVPFEKRLEIFRGLVAEDKHARRYHLTPMEGGPSPIKIVIRRARLLEDALAAFSPAGFSVRGPCSITFIDVHGMMESGIDMGGLTKELLDTIATAVTHPNRGLFARTREGFLYPHPLALSMEMGRELLMLAGSVLGKALYEGILLAVPMAPFFVARLQGHLPTLDDISSLDPEVHRSLTAVKRYTGDASDLGLYFMLETEAFGSRIEEELVPDGASVPVTNANKLQYVHLVADWHLRRRLGPAATAFSVGLSRVIPPAWLRIFSAQEVNMLLGGGEGRDVDVADMRRHCQYSGGYSASSRTVKMFWEAVERMTPDDRSALLRFVTACSRPPLGGFAYLRPPLTIHKVDCRVGAGVLGLFSGADIDRLPSASTCANMLKLPNYRRAATLREKLLMSVRSRAGFDLS